MISLFAGTDVVESVQAELNSLGNVINLDTGISVVFDDLMFGIEAEEENNEVCKCKTYGYLVDTNTAYRSSTTFAMRQDTKTTHSASSLTAVFLSVPVRLGKS